jgi:hypothetical protein
LTLNQLLKMAEQLSDDEKSELVNALIQMLQDTTPFDDNTDIHASGRSLPPSVAARWIKIREEAAAWRSLSHRERAGYGSSYIAVHQGEVVDHDMDRLSLHKRVRARFGDVPVLITPALADNPREFVLRSPRLERVR